LNFQIADYLWKFGMLDSKWTLTIIRDFISKSNKPQLWESGVEQLMRFVLRVYTSPSIDNAIREESMNIFDMLTKRYAEVANRILSEWDRR